MLPPALQLRKEDAELDALLDRETAEKDVREAVEDFNRRIVEARRQLQGGPPVVTPTRDVEAEVQRWQAARAERRRRRRRPTPSSHTRPPGRQGPPDGTGDAGGSDVAEPGRPQSRS